MDFSEHYEHNMQEGKEQEFGIGLVEVQHNFHYECV